MDYTAMVEFYFKQEEIKVPDKILKNHDLTSTYLNAQKIKEIGDVLTIINGRDSLKCSQRGLRMNSCRFKRPKGWAPH